MQRFVSWMNIKTQRFVSWYYKMQRFVSWYYMSVRMSVPFAVRRSSSSVQRLSFFLVPKTPVKVIQSSQSVFFVY